MEKIKIKISDIHHLTDARYFSAKEVEYLGFDRLSSSVNDIKLIQEWIFGPQIVSEFIGNNCIVDIQKMIEELDTEVVHFDHFVDTDILSTFSDYELFVDINLDIVDANKTIRRMEILSGSVDYFVIKSSKKFKELLPMLATLVEQFPCFIDVVFSLEDIEEIIKLKPEGIILRGGLEERVGVKSFEELDDILDLLIGEQSS